MTMRAISEESWIVSQQTDSKPFTSRQIPNTLIYYAGCLETLLSNTAHSYHLTVFLQFAVKQYTFLTI